MKTNLDSIYKTNPILEEQGVDMEIHGVTFRVRRFHAGNTRVKAAMAKYHKPYARQIEMGTLDQKVGTEITIKLFIDVCLVSWSGLKDENGVDIEMNKENAISLFKSLPEVFDALWKHANDFESYKEVVGNS